MTTLENSSTVACYLATRLNQLGVSHLFGVPGNHLGPFLSTLQHMRMQDTTSVRWIGTPTEGGAGQAADAFARVHGVGAAAVTYSVGAFNLLNSVGGAYVEYVPLIAINACPTYEQWLNYQAIGLLTSHMSQRRESNLDVYRQVTVDAQVISNPGLAPVQIDSAITACLSERRPVYLEIMEDVWDAPCHLPHGVLTRQERPLTTKNKKMLCESVDATVELVKKYGRPILWAGEEIHRFGLAKELTSLVEATRIPFCTSVGGKSAVSEAATDFVGVYNGKASDPEVRRIFKDHAQCRIGLGTWSTSKNLAGEQSIGDDWAVAAREGVSVGASYFPDVRLTSFIPALREKLAAEFGRYAFAADYFAQAHKTDPQMPASASAYQASLSAASDLSEKLTYDGFFRQINSFLAELAAASMSTTIPFTLISDAAFALLGSMNVRVIEQDGFLAQNSWLSIGYSVGAATGVAMARPEKRPMVFVGDGSFQETCQELSTHTRHKLKTVVFVLDNEGFYGIEQMLVHPCYYKNPASDDADFYNELHNWNYDRLAGVFGSTNTPMTGVSIDTYQDLDALLRRLADLNDSINHGPVLVQVRLSRHDYPRALEYKLKNC